MKTFSILLLCVALAVGRGSEHEYEIDHGSYDEHEVDHGSYDEHDSLEDIFDSYPEGPEYEVGGEYEAGGEYEPDAVDTDDTDKSDNMEIVDTNTQCAMVAVRAFETGCANPSALPGKFVKQLEEVLDLFLAAGNHTRPEGPDPEFANCVRACRAELELERNAPRTADAVMTIDHECRDRCGHGHGPPHHGPHHPVGPHGDGPHHPHGGPHNGTHPAFPDVQDGDHFPAIVEEAIALVTRLADSEEYRRLLTVAFNDKNFKDLLAAAGSVFDTVAKWDEFGAVIDTVKATLSRAGAGKGDTTLLAVLQRALEFKGKFAGVFEEIVRASSKKAKAFWAAVRDAARAVAGGDIDLDAVPPAVTDAGEALFARAQAEAALPGSALAGELADLGAAAATLASGFAPDGADAELRAALEALGRWVEGSSADLPDLPVVFDDLPALDDVAGMLPAGLPSLPAGKDAAAGLLRGLGRRLRRRGGRGGKHSDSDSEEDGEGEDLEAACKALEDHAVSECEAVPFCRATKVSKNTKDCRTEVCRLSGERAADCEFREEEDGEGSSSSSSSEDEHEDFEECMDDCLRHAKDGKGAQQCARDCRSAGHGGDDFVVKGPGRGSDSEDDHPHHGGKGKGKGKGGGKGHGGRHHPDKKQCRPECRAVLFRVGHACGRVQVDTLWAPPGGHVALPEESVGFTARDVQDLLHAAVADGGCGHHGHTALDAGLAAAADVLRPPEEENHDDHDDHDRHRRGGKKNFFENVKDEIEEHPWAAAAVGGGVCSLFALAAVCLHQQRKKNGVARFNEKATGGSLAGTAPAAATRPLSLEPVHADPAAFVAGSIAVVDVEGARASPDGVTRKLSVAESVELPQANIV